MSFPCERSNVSGLCHAYNEINIRQWHGSGPPWRVAGQTRTGTGTGARQWQTRQKPVPVVRKSLHPLSSMLSATSLVIDDNAEFEILGGHILAHKNTSLRWFIMV